MEPVRTPLENEEYYSVLSTVRRAKNCLWWLIVLSLVVQITAFVLVRFAGVVDEAPQLADRIQADAGQAATAPADVPDDEATGSALIWYYTLHWLLPTTKFIALSAGMLLILTMLAAAVVSLVGRTGGAAGFTSGFFWTLLLGVFLIPWQQIIGSAFACGALYNLTDLVNLTDRIIWNAKDVTVIKRILYYDRFIGYPVFVILLCLVVQAKFARGWRRASLSIMQADLRTPVDQNDKL